MPAHQGLIDFCSLGVISDTHDNLPDVMTALAVFRRFGVDHVVHCGDICSEEVIECFAEHMNSFKATFVLGNNDFDRSGLESSIREVGGVIQEQPVCIDWHGKSVCLFHGHNDGFMKAKEAFQSGDWDIVCYGHTHIFYEDHQQGRLLLNPGSLQNGDFCTIHANLTVRRYNTSNYFDYL